LLDEDYVKTASWDAGDVLEVECNDDAGDAQGHGLVVILGPGPRPGVYKGFMAAAQDDHYSWWLYESKEGENPSLYRLVHCAGDKAAKSAGSSAVPVHKWRTLASGGEGPDVEKVKWVRPGLRKVVSDRLAEGFGLVAFSLKESPRAAGAAGPLRPHLFEESDRGDPRGVAADLEELRRSVEKGAVPAAKKTEQRGRERRRRSEDRERRSPRQRDKPEGKERRGRSERRGATPEVRREAVKGRGASERARRDPPGAQARGDEGSRGVREVRDGQRPQRSQSRQRSRSWRRRADAARGDRRSPVRIALPRSQEGVGNDGSRQERERSRSPHARKARLKGRSRSRRRRSRSSSSRSASVFRLASASHGRGSQARLSAWARAHPGRLASQLLQTMEDRVGRDGEARVWSSSEMPAAAKSYYFRVLKVTHPGGGLRNLREMQTLCTVLDHLAHGRSKEAGDVVGQRLKAVEAAIVDGSWERARYLELVEPDDAMLATRDEQALVAQERAFNQKVEAGPSKVYGSGWQSGSWSGEKGAGDAVKGKSKGKGEKSKGQWKKY
jgi:hypothetical protein